MGIPQVRGRDFTDGDRYGSEPVAIISEALARQSFPNVDPIGRRLQCGLDDESMNWMTIVGVVGNVRQDSPASTLSAALYMPLAQHPYRANEVQVAIRTKVDLVYADRAGEADRSRDESRGGDEVHEHGGDGRRLGCGPAVSYVAGDFIRRRSRSCWRSWACTP